MAKENGNELGIALKELRLQANFSQAEVAEKISVSQGTYFRIENGMTNPNSEQVRKLARIFKISPRNLENYADYKKSISLGHLKGGMMEFVFEPSNAIFIEEAMINKQISELMKKKDALYKKEEGRLMNVDYAALVKPIIDMFDEETEETDLGIIKDAIDNLQKLQEDGKDFADRVKSAKESLQKLLDSKLNLDEPIDPEDLFTDANNCICELREI